MCVGPEAIAALGQALGASSLYTTTAAGVIAPTAAASSLATAASIGMAGMTGLSAYSSIQQGKSQNKIAQYNAQVAENQAIAARQKAEYDEERQRTMIARMGGTQRANIAAGGGELLDAGDVLGFSAEEAELDALAIRYGGKMSADAAQQAATLRRAEGRAAQKQSYFSAGSTLLTGAKGLSLLK